MKSQHATCLIATHDNQPAAAAAAADDDDDDANADADIQNPAIKSPMIYYETHA